ncbi:MAG: SGNH/GDSL hydrolase family protein [Planctomycetes bacterium]|nr:SGNH/GDSL hydrolase family protein [Planctomycetota bacterium]
MLVLGDSYTFGWAVNDVETYSARLEATLNSPGAHLMCRVINLGVPGYNTLQEYEVLRAEAALHRPSLVLLAYTVNDAEPQWTVPANPAHTYAASCLWLLDYFIDRLNRSLFPERPLFHGRAQEHSSRYMQGFAAQSPKWRTSRASLCDIGAFCRSEGVALLVVMLPDFTQRFDSSYCYTTIHHTVGQWCGELEIPFIDLLPCFLGCDHEEYWVAGDGHPNQGAHEKVAAHLLEPVRRAILASVMGLIEEMPLGSIPCGGACLGCIDAYDGRAVQGWAALEDTDSAQSRIVVLLAGVDRTYRVAVKRRLARPDVSRHYGVDGLYDHAGFWVCLALYAEAIKPGIYKIGVQVESGDRMGTMWSSHGYAAE